MEVTLDSGGLLNMDDDGSLCLPVAPFTNMV